MNPHVHDPELRREIEDTFLPWHSDPIRIARLYRWLELLDKPPIDVAAFIESAASWQQDWDDLMTWTAKP